jgi:hypothetical protein
MVILADNITILVKVTVTTTATMIAITIVSTQNTTVMATGVTCKTIDTPLATHIRVVIVPIGTHTVTSHLAYAMDTAVPAWF